MINIKILICFLGVRNIEEFNLKNEESNEIFLYMNFFRNLNIQNYSL